MIMAIFSLIAAFFETIFALIPVMLVQLRTKVVIGIVNLIARA